MDATGGPKPLFLTSFTSTPETWPRLISKPEGRWRVARTAPTPGTSTSVPTCSTDETAPTAGAGSGLIVDEREELSGAWDP